MKKFSVLALMALMAIVMTSAALGAITCAVDTPASSSSISGTVNFNVSVGGTEATEVSNCTVTMSSTLVSDSFTVVVTNSSSGNWSNQTASTTSGTDASDWAAAAVCRNSTNDQVATCTGTTGITIDNTAPGCTFSSALVNSGKYKPNQQWSVTCTNAVSATLKFGSNDALTMTESSDTCTYTGSTSTVPTGSYSTVTATTSDGLNTTSCSLTNIIIDEGVPLKEVGAIAASGGLKQSQAPAKDNTMIIIIALALVAFWWYRKK